MSKFLTLSFLLHAALAAAIVFGVPAFELVNRDRISVSVLLDASENQKQHQINSVFKKDLVPRVGPRRAIVPNSAEQVIPKQTVPATPEEPLKPEHFHADANDPNAVAEAPDAHRPAPLVPAEEVAGMRGHGALDENSAYVKSVIETVTRAKRYPKVSQDREEEGLVLLAIALTSDGSVNDVRIEQTCPFERLNRAAVDTVRSIAKFPPPPGISPAGLVTLHIPIRYKITR